ncbi:MAG: hypothetical protein JRE40_01415 [Deltaproteobacteria bacterium]|nr:hypothetical protein [Deltaproteobacteria bacterium]
MKEIKVSTREIVVVLIMLASVVYGVSDLFVAGSSKWADSGSREHAAQLDTLIAEASKVLGELGSSPAYAALIAGAEADWGRDPFYVDITPAVSTSKLVTIAYTGYLEIGTRRIAIIDGVSYEAGDELEVGGYRVKRVRPSAVVIREKGTGKSTTVPLLEE